jgi:ArsR family transcriptional regulator, arsenate/arsenite/antimonite-responsive transcriptional repressor
MQLTPTLKTAEYLAALGNEHRLKIVALLAGGERCVCHIAPEFELDPSVVSRHLAVLEQAGVIVSRRDGRWIHYRVADPRVLRLVGIAREMMEPEEDDKAGAARTKSRPRGCCGQPRRSC